MRRQELTKINTSTIKRKKYIQQICLAAFPRDIKRHSLHTICNQFLLLCQMGMDEYTASKLTIFAASGHKQSRDTIAQFEQRCQKGRIMLEI